MRCVYTFCAQPEPVTIWSALYSNCVTSRCIEQFRSMSFPLTQSVFSTVVSTKCLLSTLQFMPEGDVIVSGEDGDTCEVGFSKKTYLAMFLEGHRYYEQNSYRLEPLTTFLDVQLDEMYMATISILTTTNEHSTVWTLHEEIVGELYSRRGRDPVIDDFKFFSALATSRLPRINKSSSLWLWIRKLTVLVIFNWNMMAPIQLIRQILRSMELHLANYCASYTLAWLVDVASARSVDLQDIVQLVRQQCRRNLGDISLWTALRRLLEGKHEWYSLEHYNDLCKHLQLTMRVAGLEEVLISLILGSSNTGSARISESSFTTSNEGQAIKSDRAIEDTLDHVAKDDTSEPPKVDAPTASSLQRLKRKIGLDDLEWLLAVDCTILSPYICVITNENREEATEMMRRSRQVKGGEGNGAVRQDIEVLNMVISKIATL